MSKRDVVMVCVTTQKTCERLIRHGLDLAVRSQGEMRVVHVSKPGYNILGNKHEGEAMEVLFRASSEAGAEMTVLKSNDVVSTLVKFAQTHAVTQIVMGEPPSTRRSEIDVVQELQQRLPGVAFKVLPARGGR